MAIYVCPAIVLVQMAEPACSHPFDFEYERVFSTGDIPKSELQKMMYDDMLHFSPSQEDPTVSLVDRLSNALLMTDDSANEDGDPARRK